MDPARRDLIEALHRSGRRCVLALTGGGTRAAAQLLNVPGASRTVVEVVVPYHPQALVEFLGRPPEQFCSADTARDLAARAFERGLGLVPGEAVVGVGCTASLATDRPKRGDHRFHVAARTWDRVQTWSLVLTKGARQRAEEEAVLDDVLLSGLAEACGAARRLEPTLLPAEAVHVEVTPAPGLLAAFGRGELPSVCVGSDGRVRADEPAPSVLLPGSFNPLHQGHLALGAVAARLTSRPVAFELSVTNVDKPPVPLEEVRRRVGQFAWKGPLWLTRAPTYAEKARLFPGAVFVVGADTAARVFSPRYYGNSEANRDAALDELRKSGSRFLVAGRGEPGGRFVQLTDLAVPAAHSDLFAAVAREDFEFDCSSTELRAARPARQGVAPTGADG